MKTARKNRFETTRKNRFANVLLIAVLAAVAITLAVVLIQQKGKGGHSSEGISATQQGEGGETSTTSPGGNITTGSASPSFSPSTSAGPTVSPSLDPTVEPTLQPTHEPTSEPSLSLEPSLEPTGFPTATPSGQPTLSPTFEPTGRPTATPSSTPTISFAPSFAPLDPNFSFRIKLHWEKGYYWQERNDEMKFCIECCKCQQFKFDRSNSGCSASSCKHKSQLWLHKCTNGRGESWVGVQVGSFVQLKLKKQELCMTRYDKTIITVENCDENNADQLWKPISASSKFPLAPAFAGKRDDRPYCATQHHHPKNGELVGLQPCDKALHHKTLYWGAYN